MGDNQESAATM